MGILVGYLARGRSHWIKWADRATEASTYLLLLLLGVSVGANETVMGALGRLGWQAFALSLGSVAGSVLLVTAVSRYIPIAAPPEEPDAE
jgi:uncharacterized membrane protein YbjE (DUF340 family)